MLGLVWWAGCICWFSRFGHGFVGWLLVLFYRYLGNGGSVKKPGLGVRIRPYHQYEIVRVRKHKKEQERRRDDMSEKGIYDIIHGNPDWACSTATPWVGFSHTAPILYPNSRSVI